MTDKTNIPAPKHYFYYVRMPENIWKLLFTDDRTVDPDADAPDKPIACVCVSYFPHIDRYVRGISICAPRDTFVKRLARAKASQFAKSWEKSGFAKTDAEDGHIWTNAPVHSVRLRTLVDYVMDKTGLELIQNSNEVDEGSCDKFYIKGFVDLSKEDLTDLEKRIVDDRPAPGNDTPAE
jgi:hypothetical protein